jgi:hypothetical protein
MMATYFVSGSFYEWHMPNHQAYLGPEGNQLAKSSRNKKQEGKTDLNDQSRNHAERLGM